MFIWVCLWFLISFHFQNAKITKESHAKKKLPEQEEEEKKNKSIKLIVSVCVRVFDSLLVTYTKHSTLVPIRLTTIVKFNVFIQKTSHYQAINHFMYVRKLKHALHDTHFCFSFWEKIDTIFICVMIRNCVQLTVNVLSLI